MARTASHHRTALAGAVLALIACGGCRSVITAELPSNDRPWLPEMAKVATADFDGDQVTVRNIRNCSYLTEEIYVVDHYDKSFDLRRLQGVDFIVVPFNAAPGLAHTMLSFEFTGPEGAERPTAHLAVSVEARMEQGETYSPIKGKAKQFELMYLVADERDVLPLRTEHRDCDVYVYRATAGPNQVRALFEDVMERTNKLAQEPEFYDTLSNNCTNNIVRHINTLRPGRVPWDIRVVLPGMSDQLAYDLGLIDNSRPFAEVKRAAHINRATAAALNSPDFSTAIRR